MLFLTLLTVCAGHNSVPRFHLQWQGCDGADTNNEALSTASTSKGPIQKLRSHKIITESQTGLEGPYSSLCSTSPSFPWTRLLQAPSQIPLVGVTTQECPRCQAKPSLCPGQLQGECEAPRMCHRSACIPNTLPVVLGMSPSSGAPGAPRPSWVVALPSPLPPSPLAMPAPVCGTQQGSAAPWERSPEPPQL